jgi:hypothetical protein
MPLLLHPRCPKPVRISGLGTGNRLSYKQTLALLCTDIGSLMHRHRRLLAQKRIFSPAYYYKVGTSGNALKCRIISAGLGLYYLQISLFISIYQTAVVTQALGKIYHWHFILYGQLVLSPF